MSKKISKPEANLSAKSENLNKPNPEMNPEMAVQIFEQEATIESAGYPALEPPEAGIFATGNMSSQAWYNSKKINGLWSINENKNAFFHVNNIGWLKLNDSNADSILAMFMIACSARQGKNNVNYRKESDNKVHEIYCW